MKRQVASQRSDASLKQCHAHKREQKLPPSLSCETQRMKLEVLVHQQRDFAYANCLSASFLPEVLCIYLSLQVMTISHVIIF